MASYSDHILQARQNLDFVVSANEKINSFWDWQITPAFYVAVHLVNAHLADSADLHYRSHGEVKDAINPFGNNTDCMLTEDFFYQYRSLENLSRRARYLVSENTKDRSTTAKFTYSVHFKKAIEKLDEILFFFKGRYKLDFGRPVVKCPDFTGREPLKVFEGQQ